MLPFTAAALAAGVSLGSSAKADTAFTSFAYPLTGAPTSQTTLKRFADLCYLVTDYGIVGDNSTVNTTNLQNLITAIYATTKQGAIVFFPPGDFKTGAIDLGNHSGGSTSLKISGSGRESTYIFGQVDNGFIFSVADSNLGCPELIEDLRLGNSSTVIGTGALFLNNNNCGRVVNCHFIGMIDILMPSNIFQISIDNCTGETNSNVSTGHAGTFGIAGIHCNVRGWRATSAMQCGIQFSGANTAVVEGCGIENCTQAWIAGMATGWASSCTVSGTTLTVGGNLGSLSSNNFVVGSEIFMQGLTTTADWGKSPVDANRCVITGLGTGTGGLGTYTINRSATISSPVPCVSRSLSSMSGTHFDSITSEGCYYIGFVYGLSACSITNCGGSAAVTECVDAFASTTGFTSVSGFYIYGNCGSTTFTSCAPSNIFSRAAWYFEPSGTGAPAHITFISCIGRKDIDNITGTSSSITNGSGGAGTVLNVVSLTQGVGVGIGMRVFVSGSQVATVTGNHVTDNTLTGTGGTGTYRVDTSLNVTGSAITIKTGDDVIMPTGDSQKTALEFINCTTPNAPAGYAVGWGTLNRTFASLPGNVGSNTNSPVFYGMSYPIVDGAKSGGGAALYGDALQGGGSQKVMAFYDGTNWTRN